MLFFFDAGRLVVGVHSDQNICDSEGALLFPSNITVFGYGGFSNIPNAQLFYTQTFELPIWNSDSDPYELCRHHVG